MFLAWLFLVGPLSLVRLLLVWPLLDVSAPVSGVAAVGVTPVSDMVVASWCGPRFWRDCF